ncbi:MAG: trypsin-like peptidase domain-containing protein [Pirellulaceae bacterium]|nr:trypsin-like peptidase domain-containing protein [Pirellulaceae bacterium]
MALHITGPQSGELSEAVESAFDSPMILQQVIKYKLDDNIFNYAGFGAQYPEIRFNMIKQYNARYEIDKLVLALMEHNPSNEKLLKFAWQHRILNPHVTKTDTSTTTSATTGSAGPDPLERMLDPVRGFTDPMAFLKRFAQITQCVCRIAVPSAAGIEYGTGLLVGDATVLTNYHVMESLITGRAGSDRKTVSFLFDYHTDVDGQTITQGVEFRLADDPQAWLVDASPYDSADQVVRSIQDNLAVNRAADHLDYALVRLADSPGTKPLGAKPSEGAARRGHIDLPADAHRRFEDDFKVDQAAIFVFQHPSRMPLRMDWQKPGILGVNNNRTRVLYDVNTQHGSSGAPCFNAKLEFIALHHAGGKDWPAASPYLYNQGIPIATIFELLTQRNIIV